MGTYSFFLSPLDYTGIEVDVGPSVADSAAAEGDVPLPEQDQDQDVSPAPAASGDEVLEHQDEGDAGSGASRGVEGGGGGTNDGGRLDILRSLWERISLIVCTNPSPMFASAKKSVTCMPNYVAHEP
jgi:hypothetical protein